MTHRWNNYRTVHCRIVRHTGIPCDRPVAVGNRCTCLKHERNEPLFDNPRLCQVCEVPLPATRPGRAEVCQTGKCVNRRRARRTAERAGYEYQPRGHAAPDAAASPGLRRYALANGIAPPAATTATKTASRNGQLVDQTDCPVSAVCPPGVAPAVLPALRLRQSVGYAVHNRQHKPAHRTRRQIPKPKRR